MYSPKADAIPPEVWPEPVLDQMLAFAEFVSGIPTAYLPDMEYEEYHERLTEMQARSIVRGRNPINDMLRNVAVLASYCAGVLVEAGRVPLDDSEG